MCPVREVFDFLAGQLGSGGAGSQLVSSFPGAWPVHGWVAAPGCSHMTTLWFSVGFGRGLSLSCHY